MRVHGSRGAGRSRGPGGWRFAAGEVAMGYELRRQTREEYRELFETDRLDAEV
jgi:hypothetical protein